MRDCVAIVALAAVVLPHRGLAQTCDQQSFLRRPIVLGTSGGSAAFVRRVPQGNLVEIFCAGGTLGSLVQDAVGHRFILSNNHVLARSNAGRRGEAIVQPSLGDSRCMRTPRDVVAHLSRDIPIAFGDGGSNLVDAAIAHVRRGKVSAEIANVGAIAGAPVANALGLTIQKMGRTTCLTRGIVVAVDAEVQVGGYSRRPRIQSNDSGETAFFRDQILIESLDGGVVGGPGDSGSLVVTTDACPRPVGLLFGGSIDGRTAFANPAAAVVSSLGVSFVGGCTAAAIGTEARGVQSAPVVRAAAARDLHRSTLMGIPDAIGTAVGIGDGTDPVGIEVLVKASTPELRASAPRELDGLPVRLREVGPIVAF